MGGPAAQSAVAPVPHMVFPAAGERVGEDVEIVEVVETVCSGYGK